MAERCEAVATAGEIEPAAPVLRARLAVPLALLALYFIWGSTYLAIRFTVETAPPFYIASARFLAAGAILCVLLKLRGTPWPTPREWGAATLVGGLLLAGGNGLVSYAEQSVASGLAAVLIGTVPLWAALFASLWGHRLSRLETLGVGVGFGGIVLLNAGTSLRGDPAGAAVLVLAAASWALGSVWSRTLPMPPGLMSSAAQMLSGGVILVLMGLISGEHVTHMPSARGLWALLYLVVFGSLVAYVSYVYLLRTVRPALATSYAYVNPGVAVLLGIALNGETLSPGGLLALGLILAAVVLVVLGRQRTVQPAPRPD